MTPAESAMTKPLKLCPYCGTKEILEIDGRNHIVHWFMCQKPGASYFRYPDFTVEEELPHWETTEDGGAHVFIDESRRIKRWHAVGYCPIGCPLLEEGLVAFPEKNQ